MNDKYQLTHIFKLFYSDQINGILFIFDFFTGDDVCLSDSEPLSHGRASTRERQINIPGKPTDFSEPRYCPGF